MSPLSKTEKRKLRNSITDILAELAKEEKEGKIPKDCANKVLTELAEAEDRIEGIPIISLSPDADTSPETPSAIKRSWYDSLRPNKKKAVWTTSIFMVISILFGVFQLLREFGIIEK